MPIISDSVQRGIPRIEGTEVTVLEVQEAVEEYGLDPQQVARDFGIGLDEVYEALMYYHRNPKKIYEAQNSRDEMTEENKTRNRREVSEMDDS